MGDVMRGPAEDGPPPSAVPEMLVATATPIAWAIYEASKRVAVEIDYKIRNKAPLPWGDVPLEDRQYLIAVVIDLLKRDVILPGPGPGKVKENNEGA